MRFYRIRKHLTFGNTCPFSHTSKRMKARFYFASFIISLLSISCKQHETKTDTHVNTENKFNLTPEMVSEMNWMIEPQSFVVENNSLKITVTKGTDFFNSPEDSTVVGTAPYLFKEVEGDFVAKALVEPDFSAQWNAVAVILYIDSLNWIKLAFENSDATGPSIVSVVTKGNSDDANGVILNGEKRVWLALVRKGDIYSMHWSLDGENFKMARLTSMTHQNAVKIGLEFQSPVGDSASHQVHYFEIKEKTVEDLRNINK